MHFRRIYGHGRDIEIFVWGGIGFCRPAAGVVQAAKKEWSIVVLMKHNR